MVGVGPKVVARWAIHDLHEDLGDSRLLYEVRVLAVEDMSYRVARRDRAERGPAEVNDVALGVFAGPTNSSSSHRLPAHDIGPRPASPF